jgi:2-polyprenyl-6-methoxyphenol hydroxylase-like FAD-dependent oxidoreductase
MPRLSQAATQTTAMRIVDGTGRQIARVRMGATRSAAGNQEVELPRRELAAILYDAARDNAEFVFDDALVALEQDEHGVEAAFERGAARRFDLVVGADGLHSTARRLVFGAERQFVRHMGMYVATMPFGRPVENPHDVLMYNTPGRLVSVHPSRGNALTAFIFRGRAIAGLDYRATEQHKRIVADAYAAVGWRVPELLEQLRSTDDLYFDSVSQVHLTRWSRGRIVLLGDAASCVSLFGDGSSLAMAGAFALAGALAEDADHSIAFDRYEAAHRALTDPKQRNVGRAAALLVPKTRLGITVRNLAARVWPSAW